MNLEAQELVKEALEKTFSVYQRGNLRFAEELYKQIIRVSPKEIEALQMLGLVLEQNNKNQEAIEILNRAIEIDGKNYKTYNNLGLISKDHETAIKNFEQAISLNPEISFLYVNLAIEYKKARNYKKAISVFKDSLRKYPNSEHLWFNYGAFIHERLKFETAKKFYKKAISLNPDLSIAHYNLSACHFLLDEYEEGWKEYEWRWEYFTHFKNIRDRFSHRPYWKGEPCKHLFLYNEQGVGDLLMFSRFIKYAKQFVQKITLECSNDLTELLRSCKGIDNLTSDPYIDFDSHCSVISLPFILNPPIETEPYLDTTLQETSWEKYKDKFKIGISWSGSVIHPNDNNRSCKLDYFDKISKMDKVKLFSLQKHYMRRRDGTNLEGDFFNLVDSSDFMIDWNCTAAIVKKMDLIITVDTAVAHLAGAMGKRVFLLLPYLPDWRWGMGDRTKWYDNMTIFRQTSPGNWESVFKSLPDALATYFLNNEENNG